MTSPPDPPPLSANMEAEPADVLPVSEPKASRLPPPGRKFPCRNCAARLDFDPNSRALKCPYCGFVETIEPSAQSVEERDWEEYWTTQAAEETTLAGRSSQVTCTGCGAVVLLEDKVATDRCPYCGTHLENKPESAEAMIPPEGVLPFAVSSREAIAAFNEWIASRWFAPNQLKHFANLGRLSGMYVPFWTFDSMTYTRYSGQRGDDYMETETYHETNAQGHVETKTRTVTKTRWTYVSGEVEQFFDDVLVCASQSLPENHVRQLEPWDLARLEAFRAEFLSGFQTERYAVGLKDGFGVAREIMDGEIRRLCCQDIGGDHQRLDTVKTQHVGVTFKHLLLPVWVAAYRYYDKAYQILVNARTGEVVGSRPYSWIKITLLVVGIAAAAAAAFWAFMT